MKLNIQVDGESYLLEWRPNEYTLTGAANSAGSASIREVMPGVFSVLLGARSFTVHIGSSGSGELEVWTGTQRHAITVADTRDSSIKSTNSSAAGPVDVRAQMPGRVIKVLVELGSAVQAGQGLIVVEAMKMQNEIKATNDGRVSKIHVAEGAAVAAGESLILMESYGKTGL